MYEYKEYLSTSHMIPNIKMPEAMMHKVPSSISNQSRDSDSRPKIIYVTPPMRPKSSDVDVGLCTIIST